MNKTQLLKRLSGIEWEDFETKEARTELPKDIVKTVSAFANTSGGYIVFGAKVTNGKYIIVGVDNPDRIQNDFITLLRGEKFSIPLSSKGDIHKIDEKVVLVFRIEEMPRQAKPIYYGGDIRNTFIRMGASTQKASKPEIERMLREASEKTSDSMRLDDFGIEDLDAEAIGMFRRTLSQERPNHPFGSCDKTEMLLSLQAISEVKKGKYCLTAAGLLLFGKEIRIGYTRNDDPPSAQAAREALVNLLMHMDYFDPKGAVVKCYDDQILFRNAGCLRFPLERIEQHITEPRNPVISKVFRLLGWADRTGEGITEITKGWMSMGYNRPVFKDDKTINLFEVIFPLVKEADNRAKESVGIVPENIPEIVPGSIPEKVTEKQRKILKIMATNPYVSMQEIAQIIGIAERNIKVHIRRLKDAGRVKRVGPDKGGHWETR